MTDTPTYEALQERVQELEEESARNLQRIEVLQNKHEKAQGLLDLIPAGIMVSTPEGELIETNMYMANIAGYKSKKEVLSRTPDDYWVDPEKDRAHFLQLCEQGPVKDYDARFKAKDGTIYWLSLSSILQETEEGTRIITTFREINKYKEAEESLGKSEKIFRALIENTSDLIWEMDTNDTFTYISPRVRDLLGFDPEEVVGKSAFEFLPDKEAEYAATFLTSKNKVAKPFSGKEISHIHKDGMEITTEVSGIPILDKKGNHQGWRGYYRNITDRKRAERALKESEEKYRTLVELSPDPIVIAQDNLLKLINKAFTETLGVTQQDVANGLNFLDFIQDQDKKLARQRYDNRLAGQKVSKSLAIDILTKDGRLVPCETSSTIIQFDGRPADMVIMRDVSERRKAEAELEKAHDELEKRVEDRTAEWKTTNELLIKEIEERKKVEIKLRESQDKYRDMVETVNDIIWEVDANGVYTYVSPNVLTMLGYKPEEVMNKTFINFISDKDDISIEKIFLDQLENPDEFFLIENTQVHKDGHEIIIETSGKPFFGTGGTLTGFRGVDRDITKKKMAEESLRESEKRLRQLSGATWEAILIHDHGVPLHANEQFYDMFGYNSEELIGEQTIPIAATPDSITYIKKQMAIGALGPYEVIGLKKDGTEFPIEVRIKLMDYRDKKVRVVAIRDMSERKLAEEQIHALTQQLITAQENERMRISRELHDQVAQDLSTARIICKLLLGNQSLTTDIDQSISEVSEILHKTITSVRDMSYNLRPPGLEKLGLVHAIFQYCKDFSDKSGVEVDFNSAGMDNLALNFDTEINLYRVIQEALNNIQKHANASKATIRLVSSYPNVILRIEDNGSGFNIENQTVKAISEKRMGLRSMEERINLLQGKMDIQSRSMRGTKIHIEVPLR